MNNSTHFNEIVSKLKETNPDIVKYFENTKVVNWSTLSRYVPLPEDFIREYSDYLNWRHLSTYQGLSEGLIREFHRDVWWSSASIHQVLSEDLIREFHDSVWWSSVSILQVLSNEFIEEFKHKLTPNTREVRNTPISYELIMSFDPCGDGVVRYLEHTSKEETLTWNELIERHKHRSDLVWLFHRLYEIPK